MKKLIMAVMLTTAILVPGQARASFWTQLREWSDQQKAARAQYKLFHPKHGVIPCSQCGSVVILPGWRVWSDEAGCLHVAGEVVNGTKSTLPYVEVTFRVLDKDGAQVDDTLANTRSLPPGTVWRFEAVSTATGANGAAYTGVRTIW